LIDSFSCFFDTASYTSFLVTLIGSPSDERGDAGNLLATAMPLQELSEPIPPLLAMEMTSHAACRETVAREKQPMKREMFEIDRDRGAPFTA
jgi:hypothetical protein